VGVDDLDFVFAHITSQLARAQRIESVAQGQSSNIFSGDAGQLGNQRRARLKDRVHFMAASNKRVREIGQMPFSAANSPS
jgi:hypothetical protein